MSASADVSVVISFYNRGQYIDDAIRSVREQTVKPLEIIVVNDGSEKSSREQLDRWADVCRIIDLEKNVGPSAARNVGIQQARGRFVAFLDDDDLWLPNKLEVQLKYMQEHPDCALVSSTVLAFYADESESISTYLGPAPLTLPKALIESYYVILSTCLVRTEIVQAIGGFDARLRASEDEDFVIRLCAAGRQIEVIDKPLVRFRREDHERISRRNWLLFGSELRLCWKHKGLYYRVFGVRGILSFFLQRLHFATRETKYLDGRVRFLIRVFKVKYEARANYQQHVGGSL